MSREYNKHVTGILLITYERKISKINFSTVARQFFTIKFFKSLSTVKKLSHTHSSAIVFRRQFIYNSLMCLFGTINDLNKNIFFYGSGMNEIDTNSIVSQ